MHKILLSIVSSFLVLALSAQESTYRPTPENLRARQEFSDSRFGIFIHWGIYSGFAQGEWYMNNANIDYREYAKAADAFYPHRFDAKEWVKAIKDAGAGYVCITTRHHDSFSMWDTRQSDFNIMNTPFGRDVIKELSAACHKEKIGLHFYYSHLDWSRPEYPLGRTGRGTKRPLSPDWEKYYGFMNAQLTELLTNYGKVDCIWFDGMWDHHEDSVPFDWQLEEQYALIHRLQPACLIGNNHHIKPLPGEDIQIFERDVPGENHAGLSGQEVSRLPLETCQTMNGMWGYKIVDQNYKSTATLIRLLARTAGKGANLLLNVGPQPNGEMPAAALQRMKEMGEWLRVYGKAIYGTEGGTFTMGEDIVTTRRGDITYVHILNPSVTKFEMPVPGGVKRVSVFPNGEAVKFVNHAGTLRVSELNIPKDCPNYILRIE